MSTLLQDLVAAQADRRPDAVAIRGNGSALTYRQVEEQSNQLARVLRESGSRRGDRICLLAPRGAHAAIALLATCKADAIFVPVDDTAPAGWIDDVVRTAQPTCVLVAASTVGVVDGLIARRTIEPTTVVGSIEHEPVSGRHFAPTFAMRDVVQGHSRPVAARNRAANPAYITFPRRHAGEARGAVGTHAGIVRFVQWANDHFGVGPDDRHPWSALVDWDWSISEMLGTLAAGAVLHPMPVALARAPQALSDFVRRMGLTQLCLSPEMLTAMATVDTVAPGDFPRVKRIVWRGGVPSAALRYWMTRVGHVSFTAFYGAGEATIASAYYTVPRAAAAPAASLPVGTACPGAEVLVLDDALEPVGAGQVGELCIRGIGVSPGYWRNPEATRAVFLASPRSSERVDPIYRTGDLARRDRDGQIYVVGRREPDLQAGAGGPIGQSGLRTA